MQTGPHPLGRQQDVDRPSFFLASHSTAISGIIQLAHSITGPQCNMDIINDDLMCCNFPSQEEGITANRALNIQDHFIKVKRVG